MCSDLKRDLNKCLWAQRQKRASDNRAEARARRDKIKQNAEVLGL